jgi:hypothetical protein
MALKLKSAGNGSVTLDVPNTASDYTLTVPAKSATLITNQTAGTVLQIVQATTSTATTTTSTSFVDTTLSASIVPSSANNKILVVVNGAWYTGCTGYNTYGIARLLRSSTALLDTNQSTDNQAGTGVGVSTSSSLGISYLDSPATTSNTTYKLQIRIGQTAYSATTIFPFQPGFGTSYPATITLMEIAA